VRSGGSPGEPGVGSGSTAWKIGPSGDGASDDVVALDDAMDSQLSFQQPACPYASAESRATPLAAPPDPIYLFADHAANSRRPQAHPVSRRTLR